MKPDHFVLYANCIPVRGARRSMICDLQTGRARFIPNALHTILTEMKLMSRDEIAEHFEGSRIVAEYFETLVREDYGFWTDERDVFPPLDLSWDRPDQVTNAIIDVDAGSRHDYESILREFDELGCRAVQLRCFTPMTLAEVGRIVALVERLRFRHLDLVLQYTPELTYEAVSALLQTYMVVTQVLVHSSPERRVERNPGDLTLMCFDTAALTPASCGQVSPDFFAVTLEHFTEAQHFNTCLNRKLSIAADGSIRGCPSMQCSAGQVGTTPLRQAAKNPALVQIGQITKDQVEVCKDCELRYICTDCRAFLSDPTNPYSKPAKCAYDPYTATWITEEVRQASC